jgi:hypothetical protein
MCIILPNITTQIRCDLGPNIKPETANPNRMANRFKLSNQIVMPGA